MTLSRLQARLKRAYLLSLINARAGPACTRCTTLLALRSSIRGNTSRKGKCLLILRFQLAVSPFLVLSSLPLSSSASVVSFAFLLCRPLKIGSAWRWQPDVLKRLV